MPSTHDGRSAATELSAKIKSSGLKIASSFNRAPVLPGAGCFGLSDDLSDELALLVASLSLLRVLHVEVALSGRLASCFAGVEGSLDLWQPSAALQRAETKWLLSSVTHQFCKRASYLASNQNLETWLT